MAVNKKFRTVTIKAKAKMVRNDRMSDRDYLVVPMVMLTEGVHEGSEGAYYYPPNEIAKRIALWNAKPVVVYHPSEPSACTPEVLNTRQIGIIMNTQWDGKNNRLTAEAWLEKDRISKVDERVMEAIDNEETLELSTGLMADSDEEPGEWNGEKFNGTLFNFGPDHLAVLPDQVGACSVDDGAGFIRNSTDPEFQVVQMLRPDGIEAVFVELERQVANKKIKKGDKWYVYSEDGKKKLGGPYDSEGEAEKRLGQVEYFKKKHPKNELSQNTVRDQLQKAIAIKGEYRWVEDVYDNYFIWSSDAGLYKQEYEIDGDDVKVIGVATKVIRKFTYETVKNEQTKTIVNQENHTMEVKEIIDGLIANKSFQEGDREMLSGLKPAVLEKLLANTKPPEPTKKEEPKTPQNQMEAPKAKSVAEYLADAPEDVRLTLMNAMEAQSAEKDRLIGVITKNPQNTFSAEWLKTQDLKFLQNLSKLAAVPAKEEPKDPRFVSNNYGMAGSQPVDMSAAPVLDLPKPDFGKAK